MNDQEKNHKFICPKAKYETDHATPNNRFYPKVEPSLMEKKINAAFRSDCVPFCNSSDGSYGNRDVVNAAHENSCTQSTTSYVSSRISNADADYNNISSLWQNRDVQFSDDINFAQAVCDPGTSRNVADDSGEKTYFDLDDDDRYDLESGEIRREPVDTIERQNENSQFRSIAGSVPHFSSTVSQDGSPATRLETRHLIDLTKEAVKSQISIKCNNVQSSLDKSHIMGVKTEPCGITQPPPIFVRDKELQALDMNSDAKNSKLFRDVANQGTKHSNEASQQFQHESNYVCEMCPASFRLLPELNQHYFHHLDPTIYRPNVFQMELANHSNVFHNFNNLIEHTEASYDVDKFRATAPMHGECNEKSKDRFSDENIYQCKNCMKNCKNYSSFSRHTAKCGHVFSQKPAQNNSSLTSDDFKKHRSFMPRKLTCIECGIRLNDESELKSHYEVHRCAEQNRGSHYCEFCNRPFQNKSNLKVHRLTHSGDKPFICDLCKMSFRQKAHLIKHQKTRSHSKFFLKA